jgi:hypothetical protein
MDETVARLWNEWADRRIEAALAAERERTEQRVLEMQLEVYEAMKTAFETSSRSTEDFVSDAIKTGIEKSVTIAKKMLAEFRTDLEEMFDRRGMRIGAERRETLN